MSEVSDSTKDYFDYLENVLGIKTVVNASLSTPISNTPLLFCVENYASYSTEELDLLNKMISAVKIDPSEWMLVDLSLQKQIQKKVCVLFKDEINADQTDAELTIETFSPRVLLKNPNLKKNTWAELQKVMAFFAKATTEV